ncbi:MAG TPA: methylmalonyl Co-A mutase-associated GTPase MeaB [Candidatus Thermoplasmatota archaeon]|nr:methylmalonyl Co-A mutase-associated GTPase MeaB [Candidatus Thermoplasmatota archaeon]
MSAADLAERLLAGDRLAVARAISLAEDRDPAGREILKRVYARTGRAHVVGVTGPPGSGKSTLVDQLVGVYRKAGATVGVVAVDPTSPFTGGALLGDRVRMQSRATDPGVFIRSMGSRGHLGGLARAAVDAVRILDASGKDVVIVETVGVGQGEVDVVRLADSVIVVAVPGLGDEIQNIKAGLMEIADLFVVNKADREDADKTVAELATWLEIGMTAGWNAPVVKTVASRGEGVADLVKAIAEHRAWLDGEGRLESRRAEQGQHELLEALKERVETMVLGGRDGKRAFADLARAIARRETDPYSASEDLFDRLPAGKG